MQHLPIERRERLLEKCIASYGEAFKKFEKKVRPTILSHADAWVTEQGDLPFQIFDLNQGNSLRNKLTVLQNNNLPGSSKVELENPNFFFFDFLDPASMPGANLSAAFEAASRTILLRKVNLPNMLDCAVMYHELVHVGQDTAERATIRNEDDFNQYLRSKQHFRGEKPRIRIAYEVTAYALEIEALNAVLAGAIRDTVLRKKNLMNVLTRGLQLRKEQLSMLPLLTKFSTAYFCSSDIGHFARVVHESYAQVYDCI